MDELAYTASMDPYQFRLQNIATLASDQANGAHLADVGPLEERADGRRQAGELAPRVANSAKQTGNIVVGRGIALGSFANTTVGNIADVSVNMKTGKISVTKTSPRQDTGMTVYPDGVANQGDRQPDQGAAGPCTSRWCSTRSR